VPLARARPALGEEDRDEHYDHERELGVAAALDRGPDHGREQEDGRDECEDDGERDVEAIGT
jgi:hypothetical protein